MGNVIFSESLCVAEFESVGFYWGGAVKNGMS